MRAYILAAIICLTLILSSPATADRVHYFEQPPSAEEIRQILLKPREPSSSTTRGLKTRSVAIVPNNKREGIGFPIEFNLDSFAIKSVSKPFLNELGLSLQLLDGSDTKLIIEGHTDALGSEQYNYVLSEQRAGAVRDYLVRNFEISPHRLKIIGHGKSKLRNGLSPYDGRNRRVEFFSENSN